jgi:hypothetical protein
VIGALVLAVGDLVIGALVVGEVVGAAEGRRVGLADARIGAKVVGFVVT